MQLPPNETTFFYSKISEETGKEYKGEFTVKTKLTIKERIEKEKSKLRIIGETNLVNDSYQALESLAIVVSGMQAMVIKGPDWFTQSNYGFDLDDEDILFDLWKKINEAKINWVTNLKKMTDAIKEISSEQSVSN